ncbi:protein THEMIS2 [Acipenser ruthenus]|uniref:protein THEMIS2 n=1 Tax=Acipenser ruthenus TaxID=7906 RepID=UPI002741055B|nr:protein THEMIS2 [Acipenser ruthenus]XP_058855551.1 protein THEMIS2 [Acipenser ruthenus]
MSVLPRTTEPVSLQDYIASLDKSTLPRILQICSGVYFQGSVYEMSGSEVCLSTGDLVKVISTELLKVSCEDVNTKETFDLPLSYKGSFELLSESLPYSTVEEIVTMVRTGTDEDRSFCFVSCVDVFYDGLVVRSGEPLTFVSVEERGGRRTAHCIMDGEQEQVSLHIPLSCHGEFYECLDEQSYSLSQLLASPHLCSRRVRMCDRQGQSQGALLLCPVYEIQAIMHLRKNLVKMPSTLEVDLIDVTEQCRDVTFISPLSLSEILSQPHDVFPTLSEILEGPESQPLFKCEWLPALRKGNHLLIHGALHSKMVLASTVAGKKPKRYFLILQSYGGRFRRRPREFHTVYDLSVAASKNAGMKVTVSKYCESLEEDLPALSIGDQLEVLDQSQVEGSCLGKEPGLVCNRVSDECDDDEEDCEQISLPMYLEGSFLEKISDHTKYSILDICEKFSLPLDVKVAVRDPSLENDLLGTFSTLRLEEVTLEPTVLASLPAAPEDCFYLPAKWINMSVSFTKDPLPWEKNKAPVLKQQHLCEVTDNFYYDFRKLTVSDVAPPPRPPKRRTSSSKVPEKTKALAKVPPLHSVETIPPQLAKLTISENPQRLCPSPTLNSFPEKPPVLAPRRPKGKGKEDAHLNEYTKTPKVTKAKKKIKVAASDDDSDHDYESIEDSIKSSHEAILFY